MNLLECGQRLLEVTGRITRHSADIQKAIDGQSEIILLVGDTGAGKSTIFNLLCGAQFEVQRNGANEVLQVKQGTKNYSLMKIGTQSVTSEPIYCYNQQYNHLLIDFPGFKDTKGEIEEMVIQLLFNKIVTKTKIKLVYVLQQPLVDLPNRGTFLQDFLNLFQNQKFKFSDCFLILNQFTQSDINEQGLIQNIKQQFKTITNDVNQDNQNAFVIRNIEGKQLEVIPQLRQALWNQLAQATKVQFQSLPINKVQILSKYLSKTSRIFIDEILDFFKTIVANEIQIKPLDFIIKLQTIIKSFKFEGQPSAQQFQRLFTIYGELTLLFQYQNSIQLEQTQGFLKIYEYFEDYKDQIEGYQGCADQLYLALDHTILLDKQISLKIQQSKLQDEQIRMLKQQQIEFQQKYIEMKQEMDQRIAEIRQEEKGLKDEELAQYRQQSEQQLQAYQQQTQQNQQSQNQMQNQCQGQNGNGNSIVDLLGNFITGQGQGQGGNALFEMILKTVSFVIPLIKKKLMR